MWDVIIIFLAQVHRYVHLSIKDFGGQLRPTYLLTYWTNDPFLYILYDYSPYSPYLSRDCSDFTQHSSVDCSRMARQSEIG